MNPEELHGKRLAMIVWGASADGEEEAVVYAGEANWDGATLRVTFAGAVGDSFQVREEWLDRIDSVDSESKEILLGADFAFSVSIGPLPENADVSEYVRTGLRWPADDDRHTSPERGVVDGG